MDNIAPREQPPRAARDRPSQYAGLEDNNVFESGDRSSRNRKATRGAKTTRKRDSIPLDEHIASLETKLGKTITQANLWKRNNPRGGSVVALPPIDLEDLCSDMNLNDRQVLGLCASNDAAPLLASFKKQLDDRDLLEQLDSHVGTTTTLGLKKQAQWIAQLASLSEEQRKKQAQNPAVAICAQYARWLYNKNRYGFVARSGLEMHQAMQSCARIVLLVYNNTITQPTGFFVKLLDSQLGYPMQGAVRAKWEAKYVFSDFSALHVPSSEQTSNDDERLAEHRSIEDTSNQHIAASAHISMEHGLLLNDGEEIDEDIDTDAAVEEAFRTAYRRWREENEDLDRDRNWLPNASEITPWTAGIPKGRLKDDSDANIPDLRSNHGPQRPAAAYVARPIPPEAVVSTMNYQPRSRIVPFDDEEALACAVAFKEQRTKHETTSKYNFRWDEIAAVLVRRGTWEVIHHYYSHHQEYRMKIKDYGATDDILASIKPRDTTKQQLSNPGMPLRGRDSDDEEPVTKRRRIMDTPASMSFTHDDDYSDHEGTQAPRCDRVDPASAPRKVLLRDKSKIVNSASTSLEEQMQHAPSIRLEPTSTYRGARTQADVEMTEPLSPGREERLRDSKSHDTGEHDTLLRTKLEETELALQTAVALQNQCEQRAQTHWRTHYEQIAQRDRQKLTQDHKVEMDGVRREEAELRTKDHKSVREGVQSQHDLMLASELDNKQKEHNAAMDKLKQQHASEISDLKVAHKTELDKVNKSLKKSTDRAEEFTSLFKASEESAEKFYNELQGLKKTARSAGQR